MKMPKIASNTLSSWCFAFVAFWIIFLVFCNRFLYFYTIICFGFLVVNTSSGWGIAHEWGSDVLREGLRTL
jgi:hypothetical protein